MGEFRGHLRRLDHLGHLAWREAKRLGATAIGPEEFVLAILHPEAGESIAARALRYCGLSRETLAELTEPKRTREKIEGGPQRNPAAYLLKGRAEGIAAGLGAPEVAPEHVLLAFLWDPRSSGELERLGASRENVRARLAELGGELPQAELPVPDPRRWGPRVDVPLAELCILVRELPNVLPQGASLSFNHDWKTGWVASTEGVNLAAHIPRALARHRRLNLPPEEAEPPPVHPSRRPPSAT